MNYESTESFYNSIAKKYDASLTADDAMAREEIKSIVLRNTESGIALDFGGGTGLDLEWLTQKNRKVLFLEPSEKMREIAIKNFGANKKIVFLDKNLNFEKWSTTSLPFADKLDSVLANFAVINSIMDIRWFFSQLNIVCKKDCALSLTILNPSLKAMIRNYSWYRALLLLCFGTTTILHQNEGAYHSVHLHSLRAIQKAASDFSIKSILPIAHSRFVLVTFKKR